MASFDMSEAMSEIAEVVQSLDNENKYKLVSAFKILADEVETNETMRRFIFTTLKVEAFKPIWRVVLESFSSGTSSSGHVHLEEILGKSSLGASINAAQVVVNKIGTDEYGKRGCLEPELMVGAHRQ